MQIADIRNEVENNGFCVIDSVFSEREIELLLSSLTGATAKGENFRISEDLFAIRQVLKEIPAVVGSIFNEKLLSIIECFAPPAYFVVKSIYFDKPEQSNWVVAWHRDLTINVREKHEHKSEYRGWIKKHGQYSVQPPPDLLRRNVTIRIHLDDTNEENGALKVIPGSHNALNAGDNSATAPEQTISVKRGGVMIMKPLLLHASGRTTNGMARRVIHIELSNSLLPAGMEWSEYLEVKTYGGVQ